MGFLWIERHLKMRSRERAKEGKWETTVDTRYAVEMAVAQKYLCLRFVGIQSHACYFVFIQFRIKINFQFPILYVLNLSKFSVVKLYIRYSVCVLTVNAFAVKVNFAEIIWKYYD